MTPTLHVIEDLRYGGAAAQLHRCVAQSCERGEAVGVAVLARPTDEVESIARLGVSVTWLRSRFRVDPIAARRLRAAIAREGVGAVQTWDTASARLLRWTGLQPKGIAWRHVLRESSPANEGQERLLGRLLVAAQEVLVVDRSVQARAEWLGVEAVRIRLEANRARDGLTPITSDQRTAARRALRAAGVPLPEGAPVLATVARIDRAERLKELIWAADLVRVVNPDLRLLIVGEGPIRAACERFAMLATEPGLVHFLGNQPDLAGVLVAADCFWCASDSSAAPTPLLEALALGLPVVASEQRGREELVSEERGALLPWDDRAGWARATDRWLSGERSTSSDQAPVS